MAGTRDEILELLGFQLDQLETERYFVERELNSLRRKIFDLNQRIAQVQAEIQDIEMGDPPT